MANALTMMPSHSPYLISKTNMSGTYPQKQKQNKTKHFTKPTEYKGLMPAE